MWLYTWHTITNIRTDTACCCARTPGVTRLSYSNPGVVPVMFVHGMVPLLVHKVAFCFEPTVSLSLSPVDFGRTCVFVVGGVFIINLFNASR